jgi:hypothetical protein
VDGVLIVLAVVMAMVNALLGAPEHGNEAERRSAQKELEIACDVRLLSPQTSDYPRLDFGFFYQPARESWESPR